MASDLRQFTTHRYVIDEQAASLAAVDAFQREVERSFRQGNPHADLAHGGSPVTDPSLTRQSLVGHFCPQSAPPNYFGYNPARRTVKHHGRLAYSSEYYDLAVQA
jgi:hypothetical protein